MTKWGRGLEVNLSLFSFYMVCFEVRGEPLLPGTVCSELHLAGRLLRLRLQHHQRQQQEELIPQVKGVTKKYILSGNLRYVGKVFLGQATQFVQRMGKSKKQCFLSPES